MKINPKYIALIIGIFILCFLSWCHGRSSVETKQTVPLKVDTIRPKITKNHADLKVKADSVPILKAKLLEATNRKNYYKRLYKSVYDSVYSASDSLCKSYLYLANRIKQKQDSANEAENMVNSELIVNAFNQIGEYQDNEVLYEAKIKQDSTDKVEAKKEAEKVAKSRFWKGYGKGFKHGFVTGVAADESARAGIRMIKP